MAASSGVRQCLTLLGSLGATLDILPRHVTRGDVALAYPRRSGPERQKLSLTAHTLLPREKTHISDFNPLHELSLHLVIRKAVPDFLT